VPGEQEHDADGGATGRDQLGAPAPAELAREKRGEEHEGAGHQRGGQPEDGEGARRQLVHRAGDQGRERALVGVAPREVVAGGQEVELVAVVAVAAGEGDEGGGGEGREP
jgi:hypothetical protein